MSSNKRHKGKPRRRRPSATDTPQVSKPDLFTATSETVVADDAKRAAPEPSPTPDSTAQASQPQPLTPPAVASAARPDLGHGGNTSLAAIGERLRAARKARGLSLEDAGRRLRLPARVLRKLETDELTGIDCPIYLRGYLRSYSKLLDVELPPLQPSLAQAAVTAPTLHPTGGISRGRFLWQRYSVAATYVIITALIVVPVVVLGLSSGLRHDGARVASLDPGATASTSAAPAAAGQRTLMASMAPLGALDDDLDTKTATQPALRTATTAAVTDTDTPSVAEIEPSASADKHQLELVLTAPCWVEITAADGNRLEYGLLAAGTYRYHSDQVLNVRLGNSADAKVRVDGKPIDLQPYRRGNVAQLRLDPATGQPPASGNF